MHWTEGEANSSKKTTRKTWEVGGWEVQVNQSVSPPSVVNRVILMSLNFLTLENHFQVPCWMDYLPYRWILLCYCQISEANSIKRSNLFNLVHGLRVSLVRFSISWWLERRKWESEKKRGWGREGGRECGKKRRGEEGRKRKEGRARNDIQPSDTSGIHL